MITSKERAAFRAQANGLEAIFQIGKDGITPNLIEGIDLALEKRELIKITLLESADVETREACQIISERTRSEPIQCIGRKFVLYRKSKKTRVKEHQQRL